MLCTVGYICYTLYTFYNLYIGWHELYEIENDGGFKLSRCHASVSYISVLNIFHTETKGIETFRYGAYHRKEALLSSHRCTVSFDTL